MSIFKIIKENKTIKRVLIFSTIGIFSTLVLGTGYMLKTDKLLIGLGELGPVEIVNKQMGVEGVKVIDYVHYGLGNINLVFPIKVKPIENLKDLEGDTKLEKVESIIKEINQYQYNHFQSNPHLLADAGGNCQAKSLMFQAYADKYDIENEIILVPEHMYNRVKIDKVEYDVDLVNGTFEKVSFVD